MISKRKGFKMHYPQNAKATRTCYALKYDSIPLRWIKPLHVTNIVWNLTMFSFRCTEQTIGTLANPHVSCGGGGVTGGGGMMIDVAPPPSPAHCTTPAVCTSSPAAPVPSQIHGATPGLDLDVIHGTRPPHTYESPFTWLPVRSASSSSTQHRSTSSKNAKSSFWL